MVRISIVLASLLASVCAHANVRLELHAGGGLEGGLIQGAPRPDALAEAGAGVEWLLPGRSWGLGAVYERVHRLSSGVPIDAEHKLDLLFRARLGRDGRGRIGVGAGVRWLAVAGGTDRPASTLRGLDLLRMGVELPIARVGRASIDFYFAWTFGLYNGEIYRTRSGDMPHATREVTLISSGYVAGLQTSIGWERPASRR